MGSSRAGESLVVTEAFPNPFSNEKESQEKLRGKQNFSIPRKAQKPAKYKLVNQKLFTISSRMSKSQRDLSLSWRMECDLLEDAGTKVLMP